MDRQLQRPNTLDCPHHRRLDLYNRHLPHAAVYFHLHSSILPAVCRKSVRWKRLRTVIRCVRRYIVCKAIVRQPWGRQRCDIVGEFNHRRSHWYYRLVLLWREVEGQVKVCRQMSWTCREGRRDFDFSNGRRLVLFSTHALGSVLAEDFVMHSNATCFYIERD